MPMTSPLSMAPRTPPSPAAKPTMSPHARPNSPQLIDVALRKGGAPRGGVDDPAPAVLVRLDDQLDLRRLLVLVLGGAGLGQGLPGGVLTGEPHQQHAQLGRLVAAAVGAAPAGAAEVSTGCAAPL